MFSKDVFSRSILQSVRYKYRMLETESFNGKNVCTSDILCIRLLIKSCITIKSRFFNSGISK